MSKPRKLITPPGLYLSSPAVQEEETIENDYPMLTFFKPDDQFIKWLIKLADNRLIVDLGCGNASLLVKLAKNGYKKTMGFDPYSDLMEINTYSIRETGSITQVIPFEVSNPGCERLLTGLKDKGIAAFLCRPCHSQELVFGSYELCQKLNIDLYYIGLKKNVQSDLFDIPFFTVEHEGKSADNEIVLKLCTTKEDKIKLASLKATSSKDNSNEQVTIDNFEEQPLKPHASKINEGYKKYGVIAPDGTFYECRYSGHCELEGYLIDLKLIEKSLIEKCDSFEYYGWVKLTGARYVQSEFVFADKVSDYSYKTDGKEENVKTNEITDAQLQQIELYVKNLGRKRLNYNGWFYTLEDFIVNKADENFMTSVRTGDDKDSDYENLDDENTDYDE